MEIPKRVALVTGASRNMGRAIALELGRRGVDVALNARANQAELQAAVDDVQALGVRATGLLGDVGDRDVVRSMVRQAGEELGAVNILVHTVAVRPKGPFLDVTADDWRRVVTINLDSLFHLTQAVLPAMVEGSWGRILAFSGEKAYGGYHAGGHASATKHAVIGLTRSLAREFAPSGVTANTVVPGPFDTQHATEWVLGDDRRLPAGAPSHATLPPVGRLGRVDEVAGLCGYLTSPEAAFVTGQSIHINGGGTMV
ncbi:MAG: SDR family oxidoreductase [Chloroflexota bacterium]